MSSTVAVEPTPLINLKMYCQFSWISWKYKRKFNKELLWVEWKTTENLKDTYFVQDINRNFKRNSQTHCFILNALLMHLFWTNKNTGKAIVSHSIILISDLNEVKRKSRSKNATIFIKEHDFSPHFEKRYENSLHCRTRPDVEPTPVYPTAYRWCEVL